MPIPVDGDIPDEELDYVEAFKVLGDAVDLTTSAEDITLLLSTCRNPWMTVNAIFVDLRTAIGAGTLPDLVSQVFYLLKEDRVRDIDDQLDLAGLALSEVEAKLNVWERRHELLEELAQVAADLDPIPRSRLHGLLARQREVTSTSGAAHGRYLALSLDPGPPALRTQSELCKEVHARLRLLWSVATALVGVASALAIGDSRDANRPALFADDLAVERTRQLSAAWPALVTAVSNAREALTAFSDVGDPGIIDPGAVDGAAAQHWVGALADVGQRAVWNEHQALLASFRPNVALSPMPAPFVVDLSGADPGFRPHGRTFEVERVTGPSVVQEDTVRIGLLKCGLPEAAYSQAHPDRYVFRDTTPHRQQVESAAREAVISAAGHGCKLLAMPEVFLPAAAVNDVHTFAMARGLMLVTGVEYGSAQVGIPINACAISVPGVAGRYEQRKQGPSIYELRAEDFESDGKLWLFRNTAVGVMGVVVCSDYLELDVLAQVAAVEERLDVLLVCARNPNVEVFKSLAIADAARLYAAIVIVNARPDKTTLQDGVEVRFPATGDGTLVALPRGGNPLLEATDQVDLNVAWSEDERPSLALFDLPLAAIRARDKTNRHEPSFLPAPMFIRRQRP